MLNIQLHTPHISLWVPTLLYSPQLLTYTPVVRCFVSTNSASVVSPDNRNENLNFEGKPLCLPTLAPGAYTGHSCYANDWVHYCPLDHCSPMSHVPCTYFGAKHTLSLRNDKLLWSDRREIIKWNLSNPKINRAVIIYSSVFSGSQARCLTWSL